MTIAPHGGRLVDRLVPESRRESRLSDARRLPTLRPFIDDVYDAEKIAVGAYSPLEGFMGSAELDAVLRTGRLPSGLPWPMPILLAPPGPENSAVVSRLHRGDSVALLDDSSEPFAIVEVSETFPLDRSRIAEVVYGTKDPQHPNVGDLAAAGDTAVAGRVELLRRLKLPTGRDELTPSETRAEFGRRGWNHVSAYQCRNPPHTAHEYIQRLTLEREDVDALFIHPVVGRLKKGDYRPEVILAAYRVLVDRYYPKERVMMAAFSIAMRYAGPKAALFLAIVRKNFGCDSYIVGRDQAGVGKYYDPFACHRIFDEFPIDIRPLRYGETFYCRTCGWMASEKVCNHPKEERLDTSQTRIRKALTEGQAPPKEILRPEVFEILSRPDVVL